MIAVIQFDAASARLLERLGAEGRLPNLEALQRRGTRLELETPAEHFPASAYQNLYRGVEVGDHGRREIVGRGHGPRVIDRAPRLSDEAHAATDGPARLRSGGRA